MCVSIKMIDDVGFGKMIKISGNIDTSKLTKV